MSNNKAIAYGKEKRKPYRGGKAVAYSCRNHGDCPYCYGNRTYSSAKRIAAMASKEKILNEQDEPY